MSKEQEAASAALKRAQEAKKAAVENSSVVNHLVKSLSRTLEENHFSVRLARAFDLGDDRR